MGFIMIFEETIKLILKLIPKGRRSDFFKILLPLQWHKQQQKRLITDGEYSLKGFDEKKLIFVHIPKCAGVSISKSVYGSLGGGHMEMWKYELIFGSKFKEYFKFTVVRNPWDRVYSAYTFLKSGGFGESDSEWFNLSVGLDVDFKTFVCEYLKTKKVQDKNHFRSQISYLKNLDGEVDLDVIIRFENIDEDFKKLSKFSKLDLLKINSTINRSKDYKRYYNKNMIAIVESLYQEDIKILGYCYD